MTIENSQPAPSTTNGASTERHAMALMNPTQGAPIAVFASASNYEAAKAMAVGLAKSSLMPKEYQNNPANCLLAIEMAGRLGMSPLSCAQQMDIVHGRPTFRSSMLIATVAASKQWSPLNFIEVGVEGKDDWGFRAQARHLETGDLFIGPTVTMGTAKSEGWATRNGSKYKALGGLMLRYRAAAFWVRLFAPEFSLGLHTSEEVQDTQGPVRIDLPDHLVPGSAKALEAELLGTAVPTAPASDPAVEGEPVVTEAQEVKRKPGSSSTTPRRQDDQSDGEPPADVKLVGDDDRGDDPNAY